MPFVYVEVYATKKSSKSDSQVTGTHLHLVTFSFEVIGDAGIHACISAFDAVAMTDTSAVDMLTNQVAMIVDRDGTSVTGNVEIIDDDVLDSYLAVTRARIYAIEHLTGSTTNYNMNA